jgi:mannose/fructose/N-acetylgalactosamine-specific phosphotransferase system component IIC
MLAWHLVVLPALCAGVAALELDAVLVGQWMLSRPLLVGPLVGWVCGSPAMGAAVGAMIELFSLEDLPVGCVIPLNGTVAAAGAVLLLAGPHAVPAAAALPAGLALGIGHRALESRVRTWRSDLTAELMEALARDEEPPWRAVLFKSLALQWAMTALFLYLGTALAGPALSRLWDLAPAFGREGLTAAFGWVPLVGLAVLLQSFLRKLV